MTTDDDATQHFQRFGISNQQCFVEITLLHYRLAIRFDYALFLPLKFHSVA